MTVASEKLFDLSGRQALVTGASGGIGSAIARRLHAQGVTVVLSGTREGRLHGLADELGTRVHVAAADLTEPASVDGLIARAEEVAGPIDILIANAGVTRDGLVLRMKDADWDTVIRVNLESYFRLSRSALRGMFRRKWGRIIGVTSVVGVTGNPGQANYAAAKAGMIGFSKSVAAEVASRGVTVNTIAPGFIESPMTAVLTAAQREAILSRVPAGRLGAADEVAAACVFLASDEAAYVTGSTLHVNGGLGMF